MVYEGIDYIFYTNIPGQKIISKVLKSVSEKWKEIQGFTTTDDFSHSDFIFLPNEEKLNERWIGVYVYKNAEIMNKAKDLGVGVNEDIDKNTFQLFSCLLNNVKLETVINKRNAAFRNPKLPDIDFNIEPYKALICCSEFYEITLSVFDESEKDRTAAWLFNLVENTCMGNLL